MDNITGHEQLAKELEEKLARAKSEFDYSSNVSSAVGFILLVVLIYLTKDFGWPIFFGLIVAFLVYENVITAKHLRRYTVRLQSIYDEFLRTALEIEKKQLGA